MSPMSFSQAGTSGASSASAAGAAAARFRGPVSFHLSLDDELDDDPGAGLAAALALDAAFDVESDGDVPQAPPPSDAAASATTAAGASPRRGKTLFMQRRLLELRPLLRLNGEEFEAFLYQSRMYPTLSRFTPGNVEYCVPRRDITVGLAMKTLRERIEHAAVIAELVCRLKRDEEEGTLCNDDEAVVATAAIRDDLREALGMLGVYEQAIRDGVAVVQYREPVRG